MDRERIDIPDVFKRGMENWGGDNEGGDGPGGDGEQPFRPWIFDRRVWIMGLLFFLFIGLNWLISLYTEYLWFAELTYTRVWFIRYGYQIGAFVVFFLLAFAILAGNWLVAFRLARRSPGVGMNILGLPGIRGLLIAAGLFLAFLFGTAGSQQWDELLRFVNRVPFGVADPLFGRDVSFYLFQIPVYRFVHGWLLPLLLMAGAGVAAVHAVNNIDSLQRGLWRPHEESAFRSHVAVLVTLLFGLWAIGYWLDMMNLVQSTRGVVFGATYSDVAAVLPALQVQLALTLVLALAAAYNIVRLDLRPLIAVGAVLVGVIVIGGGLIPGLLQRYVVEPNELAREHEYIASNIEFTRLAFGLDGVDSRLFGDVVELSTEDLVDNEATLENVRVWDYRPLGQTYAQLQELRTYYHFSDVDIDRYPIDGEVRQVMLAARELDSANLPANSWINRRLEYTHGYGLVMNPVDQVTPEGAPVFYLQDIPPQATVDLTVDRPEVYYGETTNEPVFVNTGLEEFDYPLGAENVYTNYQGEGGVQLDSYFKRLAFAIRFAETNILLSEYINSDSRVMFHRQIRERVGHIAPFLSYDRDPYIVLAEGRLVWMLDAYTTSGEFPYATPSGEVNYIRNSVKVTIDAYNGEIMFYVTEPDDPLIQSYEKAFPGLFQPFDAMPESLLPHIRFPVDLFLAQTQQNMVYHMTEPQIFYNQEDRWEVPMEIFDGDPQAMEPYYVMTKLPGETETEFLLIQPYAPAGRDNMVAWLAARNDPPNYGELVAFELSKQQLVLGPNQVESRINQNTDISQQISLWNQQGSRVIRGNLIVIPINNSFLYVEPLYLESSTSALPELKRVIVASGNRIAMRNNLADAIEAFIEQAPVAEIIADAPVAEVGEDGVIVPTPAAPEPEVNVPVDATTEQLVESANQHFLAAEAAQRAGDWTTYGLELEALQRDLQQLMQLTQQQ